MILKRPLAMISYLTPCGRFRPQKDGKSIDEISVSDLSFQIEYRGAGGNAVVDRASCRLLLTVGAVPGAVVPA